MDNLELFRRFYAGFPALISDAVRRNFPTPQDAFKDPVVIEFLGLPEAPQLSENNLEGALIGNLRQFLLELGKGFAFVARQERLSLEGDHFYVDLFPPMPREIVPQEDGRC